MATLSELMSACTSLEELNTLKERVSAPAAGKNDKAVEEERTVCSQNHAASLDVARALMAHETLVGELQQCSEYFENVKVKYREDKEQVKEQYHAHREQLDNEYKDKMAEAKEWEESTQNRLLVAQQELDTAHKRSLSSTARYYQAGYRKAASRGSRSHTIRKRRMKTWVMESMATALQPNHRY